MADFTGSEFDDFFFGTDEDDNMFGLGGNDSLIGVGGNDLLEGGDGDDTLSGDWAFSFSKGADTLTGGAGNDRFEWSIFDGDSTSLTLDMVTDFEGAGIDGGDTLELMAFFGSTPLTFGGNRAAPTSGTALGTAGDGLTTIYYAFEVGNTLVFADTNDDGAYDDSDFTVRLNGAHSLVASDFGNTEFVIAGTDGDDTIAGTDGADNIFALAGNDTVNGLGGADRIDGGSGDDVINGGDGDDLAELSFEFALLGGDGNDQINGGAGNDSAAGGTGNDVIDGGDGDDSLVGEGGDDQLFGGAGNDFAHGDDGDDVLAGGEGDDALTGDNGDDEIDGGGGDDTIDGEAFFGVIGADRLTGGAGADTFTWAVGSLNSTSQVQDRVTDFQGAGVAGGDVLLLRLPSEHNRSMTFTGQLAALPLLNGVISGGGNGLTDVFFAFSGADTVLFADSDDDGRFDANDFAVRLTGNHGLVRSDFGATDFVTAGTNGNDTITGTAEADRIFGLGGNDIINGLGGADTIDGGIGNDIANGGDGNDVIVGGEGSDQLNGDAGNDRVNGRNGNDIINGGEGRDNLTGDAGNDIVNGGAGNDTGVSGGDGNDIVNGGDGNDNVDGDLGNDVMHGDAGNDTMVGGEGNDTMFGDGGNDTLDASEGNDNLIGGLGDDELTGYEGIDRNEGGAGNDEFSFFLGSFAPSSPFAARDTVVDFQGAGVAGGDVISLNFEEVAFAGGININPVIGAPLPGAGDGITQLAYAQRGGRTYLIADEDDDGVLDGSDFTVEFQGTHNFTQGDFIRTDFIIAGTNGDEVITGTEVSDKIFAAGGNDQVFALGGDDEVHGGTGNDTLDSGPGFDNLMGEEGNDTLTLAASDIGGTASGGEGDDILSGSDSSFNFFDNTLRGEAGNDDLHAGAVGSTMSAGSGADHLFSSARDDQMDGGRDEFTFQLDGAQDLFVYAGTGRWSSEVTPFGDQVSGFQDGSDLFDMRGNGLTFADLTVLNEDFQTTITSSRGMITIFENFDEPVEITAADFLFA